MIDPKRSAIAKRHLTRMPLDVANLLRRGMIVYRGGAAYIRKGDRLYTIEKSLAWANYSDLTAWTQLEDIYIDDYIITGETWKVWY